MKKIKYVIVYVLLLLIVTLLIYLLFSYQSKKEVSIAPVFLIHDGEIDDHFLVLSDESIVFSVNDSDFFSLKRFKDGMVEQLKPSYKNAFRPMLICGDVSFIQDIDGNEKYKCISPELTKYIGSNTIKVMYSFRKGYLIVLQMQNDNNVYLINPNEGTKKTLFKSYQKINGVVYSETGNYLIISYDNELKYIDEFTSYALAGDLEGDKLNPFLFEDFVYFVNNSRSEFYQVYRISLKKPINQQVQFVYQLDHDLRMPKTDGVNLFFIEVVNSEYILKRISFKTRELEAITHYGVVYNYELLNNREIVFVYADFFTPKCLMRYKQSDKSLLNISGTRVDHELSFRFIESEGNKSCAYEITPQKNKIKGVILYIHPGMHLDFSPRWDAIIMNLCYNGYIIIAPNYPMSSGYGRAFFNSSISQAVDDLLKWKENITTQYKDIPLYCLATSSGNVLMERLLSKDHNGIEAAVSLFGIPDNNEKTIPTFYILGKNDPHVNYIIRNTMLRIRKMYSPLSISSYSDEGHWFRKTKNLNDAIKRMVNHLNFYPKSFNNMATKENEKS